jgi:hypothetical protein
MPPILAHSARKSPITRDGAKGTRDGAYRFTLWLRAADDSAGDSFSSFSAPLRAARPLGVIVYWVGPSSEAAETNPKVKRDGKWDLSFALPDGKPAGVYVYPIEGKPHRPKKFKYVLRGLITGERELAVRSASS